MVKTEKKRIPVRYLPKGWLKTAQADLGYSESMIRKVSQGHEENIVIFEYLVQKVEEWKSKSTDLNNRLISINE
jgi:hypothetical protein